MKILFKHTFWTVLLLSTICVAQPGSNLFIQKYGALSGVEKRRVVRQLGELGISSKDILVSALDDNDVLVRRNALMILCDNDAENMVTYIKKMFTDSSDIVRLAVVQAMGEVQPRTRQIEELLAAAQKDRSAMVSKAANELYSPFFRNNIPIRQRVDVDHAVEVLETITLPKQGWKFKTDPQAAGLSGKWYLADFNDKSWADIEIDKAWDDFGYVHYCGEAWYRAVFTIHSEPKEYKAIELNFGGVDENAWVWLNGIYIGQHAIGSMGWDIPFNLDVTKEIRWDGINQLTVRVSNSTLAGGIWKPVKLEVITTK